MERNGQVGGGGGDGVGQRRRRSSAPAFEPPLPAPVRRSDLVAARRNDSDVEAPMSVEQHVRVDRELNNVTREFQDMKSVIQELQRQVKDLQKFVKKSPAAKRKSFRRFETSEGTTYYENEEGSESVWTLPEGADVVE